MQAAKLVVATDVSELASHVDVREGQAVGAGDVLFRLDPRQFLIGLNNATASPSPKLGDLQLKRARKRALRRKCHSRDER